MNKLPLYRCLDCKQETNNFEKCEQCGSENISHWSDNVEATIKEMLELEEQWTKKISEMLTKNRIYYFEKRKIGSDEILLRIGIKKDLEKAKKQVEKMKQDTK